MPSHHDLSTANQERVGQVIPPAPTKPTGNRKRKLLFIAGGVGLALILLAVGTLLIWDAVSESRQQTKAEVAVRRALDRWCSGESLEQLGDLGSDHSFEDPALTVKMRPQRYKVTDVKPGRKYTYEVRATLTFPGGDETRVYEVHLFKKSDTSLITTKASEDISGTEGHARSVLQAWLDCWIAGEDMMSFKNKHPDAAAKMTTDIVWAELSSKGKRLVRYEITNVIPTAKGYRFTVTAVIDDRGTPETKILYYAVYKDRILSGGRWTITGG